MNRQHMGFHLVIDDNEVETLLPICGIVYHSHNGDGFLAAHIRLHSPDFHVTVSNVPTSSIIHPN